MIALSTTCVVIIGGSPMMLCTLPILSNSWATILHWWDCGDRSAGLFRSPKPEGSDSLWRNYSKTDNIFDLSGLHILWKQENVANGPSSSDFGLLTACMQEKATDWIWIRCKHLPHLHVWHPNLSRLNPFGQGLHLLTGHSTSLFSVKWY